MIHRSVWCCAVGGLVSSRMFWELLDIVVGLKA